MNTAFILLLDNVCVCTFLSLVFFKHAHDGMISGAREGPATPI